MSDPDNDGDGPDVEPEGDGPLTAEKAESLIPKKVY